MGDRGWKLWWLGQPLHPSAQSSDRTDRKWKLACTSTFRKSWIELMGFAVQLFDITRRKSLRVDGRTNLWRLSQRPPSQGFSRKKNDSRMWNGRRPRKEQARKNVGKKRRIANANHRQSTFEANFKNICSMSISRLLSKQYDYPTMNKTSISHFFSS